jgi:hypothetical protein
VKGIIFNLAEEVVVREHGDDVWDAVLAGADVSGSYTSLGSYPDDELMSIVASAARLLGAEKRAVMRHIAKGAIPLLAERYPRFFSPHHDACALVLTLNDIIHPEVRKLYPGADVPTFTYDLHGKDDVTLTYASKRRLCDLAEGFIAGTALHYGQSVMIDQSRCMHRGDSECLLHCEFRDGAA